MRFFITNEVLKLDIKYIANHIKKTKEWDKIDIVFKTG